MRPRLRTADDRAGLGHRRRHLGERRPLVHGSDRTAEQQRRPNVGPGTQPSPPRRRRALRGREPVPPERQRVHRRPPRCTRSRSRSRPSDATATARLSRSRRPCRSPTRATSAPCSTPALRQYRSPGQGLDFLRAVLTHLGAELRPRLHLRHALRKRPDRDWRAHVPAAPSTSVGGAFGRPVVVWPEEPFCPNVFSSSEQLRCGADNAGAYVAVATNGDTYVAWERKLSSEFFNGDPHVYEHAAPIPAGATSAVRGGPRSPVVLTLGGRTATTRAVSSRSRARSPIPGYSRSFGNDFPRLAVDSRHQVESYSSRRREPSSVGTPRCAPRR